MTERGTCWSITVNNPTDDDLSRMTNLPAGWKLKGQMEKGETNGVLHAQCMLSTPQVRFSAVKRHLPRAHIELARSKTALDNYVGKPETRVGELQTTEGMTCFQLTDLVCDFWNDDEFEQRKKIHKDYSYLDHADHVVTCLISGGEVGGIEYVAINPMWRSAWKRFGSVLVERYRLKQRAKI